MAIVKVKKAATTQATPKSECDGNLYILVEKQLKIRVCNGDKKRDEKKHVFETQAEYAQYWDTRWAKMTAAGFEQMPCADKSDTRVIMQREENGVIYTLVFDGRTEPKNQAKPKAQFVGPDGQVRTAEEVDETFDIEDFKVRLEEREEEDEPQDLCKQCDGKGWTKCGRGGEKRSCIACNGTGMRVFKQDYHAEMPNINLPKKQERVPQMVTDIHAEKFVERGPVTVQAPNEKLRVLPEGGPAKELPMATYTVSGPGFEGGYRTIRLRSADFNDGPKVVIDYMVGPDNEHDFVGCGFYFQETGRVSIWKRFREYAFEKEIRLAIDAIHNNPKAAGLAYAQMSGNCCICGRKLTTPESLEAGIGPVCMEKAGW